MKICIVSGSYPPIRDGVGDYVRQIAHQLRTKQELEITVITSKKAESEKLPGLEVHPLFEAWGMKSLPKLVRAIFEQKPDIVNIQYPTIEYGRSPMVNILPLFLQLNREMKILLSLHEYELYSKLGKFRIYPLLALSDYVVVKDRKNKESIRKRFDKKVKLIPTGNQIVEREDLIKNSVNYSKRGKIDFIYWGFVREDKGIEYLIRAFNDLNNSVRQELNLYLAANLSTEDGYQQEIRELIQRLDLREQIQVVGYQKQDNLVQMLSEAMCCVLPFKDGISERRGTFIATMQLGVPIITTDSNYLPKGLIDGKNVLLAKRSDEDSLRKAMKVIIEKPSVRERLSKNGKAWSQRFSWEVIAKDLISLYRSLMDA